MNKSKPSILFVLDYCKPHVGGLEVVFDHIIQGLLAKGYDVGIVSSRHTVTLPEYEENGNLRIWRVGKDRYSMLRLGLLKTLEIAKHYDIIHTTTYASALPASIVGLIKRKPVLITIHEVFGQLRYRFKKRGRLFKFFEWLIFQFPYKSYVCVSNYTKNMVHRLYHIPKRKLNLIYNGVDRKLRSSSAIDPQVVVNFRKMHQLEDKLVGIYYGHSGISKGIDELIYAIPHIVKKYPNFHAILNIIPTRRDHKILDLINQLGINNHILLLHGLQQKQLVNIVSAADFAIVPSISEGFGLVAAEVSELGKPLIVTQNAALPEVVHGKVIFLQDNHTKHFVNAIQQVIDQKRENIPHKTFDRQDTIDQYESLYLKMRE